MNRPLIVATIGLVAVIVALILSDRMSREEATETPPATAQSEPNVETTATSAPVDSAAAPSEKAVALPAPPSFDVVRISPDGDAVIAGRGEKGADVIIKDDDTALGKAIPDNHGEWVFVPDQPLKPGARRLSLEMILADGTVIKGTETVVLVVPERRIASTKKKGGTLALKVTNDGRGGITVLQKPKADATDRGTALTIDAVDYDAQGRLVVSGQAKPSGRVQLYLDNHFLGRVSANASGRWTLTPDTAVQPGRYTMRADHVSETGKVLARVTIPFQRSEDTASMEPGQFIVVQPGNSLWRLARRTYGTGFRFAVIYQANKEQITDPDMIYPGQVFALPKTQ